MFYSLSSQRDWENGRFYNTTVVDDSVRLKRQSRYAHQRRVAISQFSGLPRIVSIAPQMAGKVYLLAEDASVYVVDLESHYVETFLGSGHRWFSNRAVLATLPDLLVVTDETADIPVVAFAQGNAQALWTIARSPLDPFTPLALVSNGVDSVFMLSCVQGNQLRISRIRRNGREDIREDFTVGSASTGATEDEVPITRLLTSQDVDVFIHAGHVNVIVRPYGEQIMFDMQLGVKDQGDYVLMDGATVVVSDGHERVVWGVHSAASGESKLVIDMTDQGTDVQRVVDRPDVIVMDDMGRITRLDRGKQIISRESIESQISTLEIRQTKEGAWVSSVLDSGEDETVWHKLMLDAQIPPECQIRVQYLCTDYGDIWWRNQRIRLSELHGMTAADLWLIFEELSPQTIVNATDALFFKAKGRYLCLMVQLAGTSTASPAIERMRVHFPRESLVQYLPEVYQENVKSADFLTRYLALMDHFLEQNDEAIDHVSALFDIEVASGTSLSWLAEWLAVAVDSTWTDQKIRTLLRELPSLYPLKGTRKALERVVEIYTGEKPLIVEYAEYKDMLTRADLVRVVEDLYGNQPYTFTVLMNAAKVPSSKERYAISKLVESWKPAFTAGRLVFLNPWIYMDMHSYLGVNTVLSEPTLLRLDSESILPHDTVIIDLDADKRLDIHTRLELDSELDT